MTLETYLRASCKVKDILVIQSTGQIRLWHIHINFRPNFACPCGFASSQVMWIVGHTIG